MASDMSDLGCTMQDYSKLDKFKDALKQAAQTVSTIKIVFADATVNSGALFPSDTALLHGTCM